MFVCLSAGQFICSEKRCNEKEHLRSWEVLFAYVEHEKKRDALVKLRMDNIWRCSILFSNRLSYCLFQDCVRTVQRNYISVTSTRLSFQTERIFM
jgi:hypothetical protein